MATTEHNQEAVFESFNWGNAALYDLKQPVLLRMFAYFLDKTKNVTAGATTVCDLLENDRRLMETDQQPLLTPNQHSGLALMAGEALRGLDHEASEQLRAIEQFLITNQNRGMGQ